MDKQIVILAGLLLVTVVQAKGQMSLFGLGLHYTHGHSTEDVKKMRQDDQDLHNGEISNYFTKKVYLCEYLRVR